MAVGAFGACAASDYCTVFFEVETAAAGGAEHLLVEAVDRGLARQQFVAAVAAEFAAVLAAAADRAGDARAAAAGLGGNEAERRSVHLPGR